MPQYMRHDKLHFKSKNAYINAVCWQNPPLVACCIVAKVPWCGTKAAALLGVTEQFQRLHGMSLHCWAKLWPCQNGAQGLKGNLQLPKMMYSQTATKNNQSLCSLIFSFYVAIIVLLLMLMWICVGLLWHPLSWHQLVSGHIQLVLWQASGFWQFMLEILRINVLVQPFWFQHLEDKQFANNNYPTKMQTATRLRPWRVARIKMLGTQCKLPEALLEAFRIVIRGDANTACWL